ncbi:MULTISPECIES: hypothetical protein [unclassified Streptomyces]|uniref:hypothetical protein n=1 Tax=unclassified Streptomyces TaxID=2593676 RepID=UPI002E2E4B0C|nr:hypothetical protein [Streptomyces sp. NBC_01439]
MTPTLLEARPTAVALSRTRHAKTDEVQIIEDITAYTAPTAQGCGDDNPYN